MTRMTGPDCAVMHVCVCVFFPFILDVWLVDVPAGVTQEEGHTGFFIHLPSAVLALIFIARRIQPCNVINTHTDDTGRPGSSEVTI